MVFSDYTRLEGVLDKFHLVPTDEQGLFGRCPPVAPSEAVRGVLQYGLPLATAIRESGAALHRPRTAPRSCRTAGRAATEAARL